MSGVRRCREGRTSVHGRTSLEESNFIEALLLVGKLYLASPLEILFDLSRPVADPRCVLSSTVLAFTPVVRYIHNSYITIKLCVFLVIYIRDKTANLIERV